MVREVVAELLRGEEIDDDADENDEDDEDEDVSAKEPRQSEQQYPFGASLYIFPSISLSHLQHRKQEECTDEPSRSSKHFPVMPFRHKEHVLRGETDEEEDGAGDGGDGLEEGVDERGDTEERRSGEVALNSLQKAQNTPDPEGEGA